MFLHIQRFRSARRGARLSLILAVSLAAIVALCLHSPVRLGPDYHDFADKRTIWGIPNGLDVLSNIPFVLAGIYGVLWLLRGSTGASFRERREKLPYYIFFAGVALTGAGSFWYHLAPCDPRLPWDLLPMTASFLSMLAALIIERISLRAGLLVYMPMLSLGVASVAYWYFTEMQGHGDYRFYLFVQFFPPLLLALIVALFPPRYTGTNYLVVAFMFFVLAKVFEALDWRVYSFGGAVSGHTLKHVTAAVSCYWILIMLQRRRIIHRTGDRQVRYSVADCQQQPI